MTLELYQNKSIPNKVNKDITLVATLNGSLRSDTSILAPSFLIVGSSANLNYNYFKVVEWNRYYFTTAASFNVNDTMSLAGVLDPLMSFASDIRNSRAIVARQEYLYNLYLDDNRVVTLQKPKHKVITFPNKFNDFSFILALAGNGTITTPDPTPDPGPEPSE